MIASAVLLGLLGSGALVWQGTAAVFSGTTSNASNAWSTGSVSLTDDDSNGAMFSATNLVPGSTGSKCINVTYGGSVATTVKVYAASPVDTSSIAQYINLEIEEGDGGGFNSCAGFTATGTIYDGAMSLFNATTAYATGVGTWAPSGTASKVYKITYTVGTDMDVQGASTTVTFTWEAQAGS